MMNHCAEHRPYIGAIADGELELVSASTQRHVTECPDCAAELEAHRLLTRRLHEGLAGSSAVPHPRRPRTRVRLIAAAAGVAATAAGLGVAGWSATHRAADTVGVALAASGRAPEVRSADPTTIALWCSRSSDRRPPPINIASLQLEGARMDPEDAAAVVTVFYRTPDGGRISIGWTDSDLLPPARGAVEARQASGRTVLVVHAPGGNAVVSGDVPLPQLWRIAGALEAASG